MYDLKYLKLSEFWIAFREALTAQICASGLFL